MAAEAAVKKPRQPDYGLDAPLLVKRMFTRAAWTLAIGVAVFMINRQRISRPRGTALLAVFCVIALGFLAVGFYMMLVQPRGKAAASG